MKQKYQVYNKITNDYSIYKIGDLYSIIGKNGAKKYRIINIAQERPELDPKIWQEYGIVITQPRRDINGRQIGSWRAIVTARAISE